MDGLRITRALYRAEVAKPHPEPARLDRLSEIGQQYRRALDMAAKYGSDTMGGRAALGWAERATEGLGAYVADSEQLTQAVAATGARLRRCGHD